ncbi:MAG: copper chaperone PCu(A)C [Pseudomonadota bacterium]
MRISRYIVLVCGLSAAGFSSNVQSQEFKAGDLTIGQPWARETSASQANGAAYFAVKNANTAADRLNAATSDVAERIELHTHLMEDGVMKMREVAFIEVPAEGDAALEPGGLHIMLLGLKSPLVEGESFSLTLEFENAGAVEVSVKIEDVAGPTTEESHGGH